MKLHTNVFVNCDGRDDGGCPHKYNGVANIPVQLVHVEGRGFVFHEDSLKKTLEMIGWTALKMPSSPYEKCWICPTCSKT
jgi:hypothetical protein